VILTDNGSEFKDPQTIETDEITGEKLINVFYCHPSRSDEKGSCERNHRELRRMVPQGISWKPYKPADITFISNNVNNYYREQFKMSPYQKSLSLLDKKVLDLNNLKYISPKDVNISRFIKK
jgi:IS30 family transposase